MSHPVPATLYRIAAAAGCGSAAVLLINAAKRAEVIPTSPFTQLVAPFAQILALALVTALYLAFGRRTGTFGLVGVPAERGRPVRAGRGRVRHQSRVQGPARRHGPGAASRVTGHRADRRIRAVP